MGRILESLPGLLLLLGEGLLVALAALILHTAWTITHPPRRTFATALAAGRPTDPSKLDVPLAFEEWTFRAVRGPRAIELPVWDIKGRHESGPVVILTHAWGDSRIGALSRIPSLADRASRIIAWDMAGHGEAPGTCSLGHREVNDLLALIERVGREREIVLFGWSFGAGVSIATAARANELKDPPTISGVIAESASRFVDTAPRNVMIAKSLPYRVNLPIALRWVGWRCGAGARWRGFDRVPMAAMASCPLLFIHGQDDPISPLDDAFALAGAAKNARVDVIPNAGHVGLWSEPSNRARCEWALDWVMARRDASL
ncbi:MAG: alpha/beta fold hydrolase [Phycisphaerales bacterium]|jgi:pimeloyl-ACP methyl ester carboxylesterase|nr:alpha/beta fold hydrolase [Phycisphaerales bacterium]